LTFDYRGDRYSIESPYDLTRLLVGHHVLRVFIHHESPDTPAILLKRPARRHFRPEDAIIAYPVMNAEDWARFYHEDGQIKRDLDELTKLDVQTQAVLIRKRALLGLEENHLDAIDALCPSDPSTSAEEPATEAMSEENFPMESSSAESSKISGKIHNFFL
jgi:hypothetical protein